MPVSTTAPTLAPSARALAIEPSATLALGAKARALRAAGKPIISFELGEPDFPTPQAIKGAAARALADNFTHYTAVGGDPALKQAIADRTAETNGVPVAPNQVLATAGAKAALYLAFQATCNPGDEVIIPAPYWVTYAEQIRLAGATPIVVQPDPANWKLTPDMLREHLTDRTRLLVLCTPSNPSGIVYSESELAALADVLRETSVGVIVDEIYARISYVPVGRWLRVAPDLADRTILVDGASKVYAMTGWRMGWLVGPAPVVAAANAVQSHLDSHPASIAQRAALEGLNGNPEVEADVDAMVREFHRRRDAIVAGLRPIEGLHCPVPDGAFYVYPDVRDLLGKPLGPNARVANTSAELAASLLDDALVSIVPGEAFGTPGFLRLSYALSMDELQVGVQRLQEALKPAA